MSNKHGGHREGAGRKSKAEELGLIALIDEVVTQKDRTAIIKKLADKAKEGSFNHIQLFMYYYYGKPTEQVNLSVKEPRTKVKIRFDDD